MLTRDRYWSLSENFMLGVYRSLNNGDIEISICLHFNNQPDALIIQIYSVIKLYLFRASSLPFIRSFRLYIRHW